MLKLPLYTAKGVKKESEPMPKVWISEIDKATLAQVLRVYADHKHGGRAKVKTRGEVSISTRKIYRQKGTGGARHGAKSAPIFVGGGVTHGPKGIKRVLKNSRKKAQIALKMSLNLKAQEGNLVVVKNLSDLKKTKEAQNLFTKILKDENKALKSKLTVILSPKNNVLGKVFRNLYGTNVIFGGALNAYDVYYGGMLVVDAGILEKTQESNNEKEKVSTKTKKKVIKKNELKKKTVRKSK